jgi:hypothetical protein
LLRLSLRSRLAIWRFLSCALRAARLFSTAACFWLKIASSGTGALAGTRWAHFNRDDEKARWSAGEDKLREDQHHNKRRMKNVKKTNNLQFFLSPRWGASGAAATAATSRVTSRSPAPHGAEPRAATEAMVRSRSHLGGPVSCHVVEAKRLPPERHNTSGVVLPDHFC